MPSSIDDGSCCRSVPSPCMSQCWPSFSVQIIPSDPSARWISLSVLVLPGAIGFLLSWHLSPTTLNYKCYFASFSLKADYELVQVRALSDLPSSLRQYFTWHMAELTKSCMDEQSHGCFFLMISVLPQILCLPERRAYTQYRQLCRPHTACSLSCFTFLTQLITLKLLAKVFILCAQNMSTVKIGLRRSFSWLYFVPTLGTQQELRTVQLNE